MEWWEAHNGRAPDDPAKLARALIRITNEKQPPRRFIAGVYAMALAKRKADSPLEGVDGYRDLSTPLDIDEREPTTTRS